MKAEKIEVKTVGAKAKFKRWIENHSGVKVWMTADGNVYTPAKMLNGCDYPCPFPVCQRGFIVTNIRKFRFAKEN